MYVELSLLLLSMAVFLMAAFTAPLLYQVRKLVKGLQVSQEMLQRRLPDILKNLDEAAEQMKLTVHTVNDQVAVAAGVVKRVQAVAEVLMEVESVLRLGLRLPFFVFLRNAGAVMKGVRVFLNAYSSPRRQIKG
ncbi:MAG TPA: hypothetical protein PLB95_00905 [Syntrophales bacterium]|jgi:predicted PurR-regulated permease PerM|nr:hypothetical protein [Syntrophales bacterium]HPX80427.1 hypothetical protein [Syntrophales bacterium]HQB13912.1 hypothetical protein [Syntrophales bacterium]